ncbi:hypothetical protein ACOBV8_18800 (plasmid) [Pseudoalteromonas espejiana]
MRKKSVSLAVMLKVAKSHWPLPKTPQFPPENLADYIVEFRALLDSAGTIRYVWPC